MRVRFYVSAAGRKPAAEYIRDLNAAERAALTDDLRLIQQMGLVPSGVTTKHIAGRLYEIKSKAQRAFYVMVVEPEELVVLHIYKKQGQKAPVDEIAVATKRMKDEIEQEAVRIQEAAEEATKAAKQKKK
jgi:phage-related protein